MTLSLGDFLYDLPERLIAQQPCEPRDACRLLCLNRADGGVAHRRFTDIVELLGPGDLLVVNDTRVLPAKFVGARATGGRIEGLFLRESSPGVWEVLLRNAGRCGVGERLTLGNTGQSLVLEARGERGMWQVRPDPPAGPEELLEQVGATPLPPYIHRPGPLTDTQDRTCYQTVFARVPGAVAAPTAGLHFTPALLEALERKGVGSTRVTLHVGLGTFTPVKAESLVEHRMHSEWFELSDEVANVVAATKAKGGRVVAVGTTAVRVLESAGRHGVALRGESGWTDLFLYPPVEFAVVDALITNFHLPASTLLMLVAAFCSPGRTEGRQMILDAYRQAVAAGYRFYSYGDAMLIE